jgi:hypothetical protein
MYPAMLLKLLLIAFVAAVHEYSAPARKVFSLLGLRFALVAVVFRRAVARPHIA